PPDIPALIGASVAVSVSDIPFAGPIGGVRIGRVNGEFVVNPTQKQSAQSDLDLVVAGTREAVMMVEAAADEVPEEIVLDGIMFGHGELVKVIDLIDRIQEEERKARVAGAVAKSGEQIEAWGKGWLDGRRAGAVRNEDKKSSEEAVDALRGELLTAFQEQRGEEALET